MKRANYGFILGSCGVIVLSLFNISKNPINQSGMINNYPAVISLSILISAVYFLVVPILSGRRIQTPAAFVSSVLPFIFFGVAAREYINLRMLGIGLNFQERFLLIVGIAYIVMIVGYTYWLITRMQRQ